MGIFSSKFINQIELSPREYYQIKESLDLDFEKTVRKLIPKHGDYPFSIILPKTLTKKERHNMYKKTIKGYITMKSHGEEPHRQMTITVV